MYIIVFLVLKHIEMYYILQLWHKEMDEKKTVLERGHDNRW